MRIAYIVDSFPHVSETFIVNQIVGMAARGHTVDIYITSDGIKHGIPPAVNQHGLMRRTHRLHGSSNLLLRMAKTLGLMLAYGWRIPQTLLRVLDVIRRRGAAGSLRLLYAALTLHRLGTKHYDVIHAHFGPNGLFGLELRKVGALSGRLVTTFHGYDITTHLRFAGKYVYEPLFHAGDLFLPISEHWRRRLIELGCVGDKIVVHRMAVDCREFSFRAKKPNRDGIVRLVSIARLVEKKGIEYGIRAVAKIANTRNNIIYNVIGDGPLRDYLAHLSADLGIARFVHLLGWKRHEEIVQTLEDSHILLAPSITAEDGDQEGIPVVLMEAMAMGLPVVSTSHSGIPELVEDGVSGFLVPERDVDALVDRLTYLFDHPEIWTAMGQMGRRRVEAEFDIDKLNDELVTLYQTVSRYGGVSRSAGPTNDSSAHSKATRSIRSRGPRAGSRDT